MRTAKSEKIDLELDEALEPAVSAIKRAKLNIDDIKFNEALALVASAFYVLRLAGCKLTDCGHGQDANPLDE